MSTPTSFAQQRISLIHTAMHEFVVTHKPATHALYPLLNLIALLVQKPLLMVVFKKPVDQVGVSASSHSDWVHTIRYPTKVREKCDRHIAGLLKRLDKDRGSWVIDLPAVAHRAGDELDSMHAIGVLFLDLKFKAETAVTGDERPAHAGQRLSATQTQLEFLGKQDFGRVRELFESIRNHTHLRSDGTLDYPHLRHVARYWSLTRDHEGSLFEQPSTKIGPDVSEMNAEGIAQMLKPVFREIDAVYRELRGGTPGSYNLRTRRDAGAALLWGRHREAIESQHGYRPPTIAFYLQLRAPVTPGAGDAPAEHGYRIVPLATYSMCLDLAGVLIDYFNRVGSSTEIFDYLAQLGIHDLSSDELTDLHLLAGKIFNAVKIENFLDWQYYHTMVYPAFASGVSMFLPAQSCSRVDSVACGPDFLAEDGGRDTAFVKPTLVSGFPFISFVTKTRAAIDEAEEIDFESFYYNYTFHMGVVRRWLSRRIRSAVESAYLQALTACFEETFREYTSNVVLHQGATSYDVELWRDWDVYLQNRFDQVAMTMPFARVVISNNRQEAQARYEKKHEVAEVLLMSQRLFFWTERNNYYDRKLINNDTAYISLDKVSKSLRLAVYRVTKYWSDILDGREMVKQ